MPRLNKEERNQAIGMLNVGMSATVVSQYFGCTRNTIERLRRRFRDTGNIADRPRSGRPCVTTAAVIAISSCSTYVTGFQKTVWYSSTDCQKSVETKRSTYSCVPTVLQSNSHPTSSKGKAGLVQPSPALPTC